ncbi:MAG: PAS domain S-box protein [Anaerolineae bacterium]
MESDASMQAPTPGSPDQLPSLAGLCAFAREPFFLLDRGCRLLYANPAAERLFRRGQEGLLGKHLCEVYPAAKGSEFEQACLQALAGRHLDEALARPGGAGALAISSLPFPLLPSRWAHLCPLPAGVAVLISSALSADDMAQRLQLLLDHVPAILYMDEVGPDGTVVNLFVGGAIEQILGFTAAEWTADAQLWLRQLHPQDRERVIAAQEEWRRTGQPASIEFRYIAKDGGSVWVREEVTVISDEPSRSRFVCGVVRDITAQRQAAEREHALRSQLEGILGAVRDLVVYQDVEQRVLWANEAAAASLGLQVGGLLGRHCYALWHGRQEPCPLCPVAEARRTLMPAEGRVQTPDGRIWDIRGYPVLTDGKLQGIVEVTRDVTEQVKQGEALAENEARYRLVVERGGQSIIVVSGEKVIFANEQLARLLGCSLEELRKARWLDFVHPDDRAMVWANYQQRLRGEPAPEVYEFRAIDTSGKVRWVELRAAACEWEGRVAVIGFLTDISERRALEEQFRQAQKMEGIGRLAGGVAHDFNNLLTALMASASFALDALSPDHPAAQEIEDILASANRAADLTRRLLVLSRRSVMAPRIIDLNELVLSLDKTMRRLLEEDIELVTLPAERLWAVRADPAQIEQVILNLAVNARDAMPEGGKLVIETGNVELGQDYARAHLGVQPGQYVMLAISDSGAGMSEEVKAHLFEPFFTTKEVGKGTGLGLATTYGIVKQHGGHIYVYSELGEGTTFKVYLPRSFEAVEKLGRRDEESYLPAGQETVLVVEDEPSVRRVEVRILREQGYQVLEAANGVEAMRVAMYHPGPIHLLLTDVVMPQMSGRELAERLRAIQPKLKVLYLSGYTDNAIVHRGVLDEGVAFLQKPFTIPALAGKVRQVLDS